jgi:hypothetical protein
MFYSLLFIPRQISDTSIINGFKEQNISLRLEMGAQKSAMEVSSSTIFLDQICFHLSCKKY